MAGRGFKVPGRPGFEQVSNASKRGRARHHGNRQEAEENFSPHQSGSSTGSSTGSIPKTAFQGSDNRRYEGQTRPSGQMDDVSKKFSKLNTDESGSSSVNPGGRGDGKPGENKRRKGEITDVIETKPAHIKNKKGRAGKIVKLSANYFPLKTVPDWVVYQYHVDFEIEEDRTFVKKLWLREHNKRLGNAYLFDGAMLFSSNRLMAKGEKALNLVSKRQTDGANVPIKIRLVKELNRTDRAYIQIFNILMRNCLRALELKLVGRDYFDAQAKFSVDTIKGDKIELWPGYITSIRQHERQILMVAEITHKFMRKDTAYNLLCLIKNSGERDLKGAFQRAIMGQTVLTYYLNKTYRVDDVDFDTTPESTFIGRNGEAITYLDYYRQKYDINIRDRRQPLLVSRPTERAIRGGRNEHIMLIPELCRLTGLTDQMRTNYPLMNEIAKYTRLAPTDRFDKLMSFSRRLQDKPKVQWEFQNWGMELSPNLVEFEGRELPQERIIVNGSTFMSGPYAEWTRELQSNRMYTSAGFTSFAAVIPYDLREAAISFIKTMQEVGKGLGFQIPIPTILDIKHDGRITDILSTVENHISQKQIPSLMMFFCSSPRADRYEAIKAKCCYDRAIPSQVILRKNLLSKNVKSIATKVAIQLNSKLGGVPWMIELPRERFGSNLMVVGYDVCHDTSRKHNSVGAFVASLNFQKNLWFSRANFHSKNEEIADFMSKDITSALRKFKEVNGRLPETIIFYRDGVGEGQIEYVHKKEVDEVKKALNKMYGGEKWKLAYIIVTKRINTRIFLQRGRNQFENPRPGTVVDDIITSPEKYDFFLVSQSVKQGTVTPTAYNIIYESVGWSVDDFQSFSYKMTHLYYNWSGTVRVPAPAQYAHKLAFLVGKSLHRTPNEDLCTKLFFL